MATEVVVLTETTVIADGGVYRKDWDDFKRYYLARIFKAEPRYPDVERVQVRFELEGDPTAWAISYCDADDYSVNEAARDCVSQIEDLCEDQWEDQAWAEKRDTLTKYERKFGI